MDNKKVRKRETIRAIKFGLFSASAGIIQALTFTITNEFTNWSYWPCYLLSVILSTLWNFTHNRKYTFKAANNVGIAMLKVFAFYCVFTPVTTIGGNYFAENLGVNEYIVAGCSMALNLVCEFLYDKYFVYRNALDTNALAKRQREAEEAKA